jgi:hypothetical protein
VVQSQDDQDMFKCDFLWFFKGATESLTQYVVEGWPNEDVSQRATLATGQCLVVRSSNGVVSTHWSIFETLG